MLSYVSAYALCRQSFLFDASKGSVIFGLYNMLKIKLSELPNANDCLIRRSGSISTGINIWGVFFMMQ